MSEQTLVAILGCVAVLVLMLIRVPIAISLAAVAVAGFGYLVGPGPALGILIDSPIRTITNFNFSVIPMFILMGALVSLSGMSRELFRAANAWVGHLPGGMAIATIFACGGFAAINGSSVASAATMTQVALPEMRRVGYDPGFSAGVVAAGGTLGIMIPPSVMFILYAILTDTDLASLFIAGIIPGVLAIALYCATILIVYRIKKEWMPAVQRADRQERWESVRDVWATLLLFTLVVGGIYGGIVTISEAAGLGAFGAAVIGVARRRLPWARIVAGLVEALRTSAAIFFILIAAFLFQYFLAVTQMSQLLGDLLTSLPVGPPGRRHYHPGVLHHRRHVRGRACHHSADHPDRLSHRDRHGLRPGVVRRPGSGHGSDRTHRSARGHHLLRHEQHGAGHRPGEHLSRRHAVRRCRHRVARFARRLPGALIVSREIYGLSAAPRERAFPQARRHRNAPVTLAGRENSRAFA
jgi:tripartite ATP-independent transporter DctM subunit